MDNSEKLIQDIQESLIKELTNNEETSGKVKKDKNPFHSLSLDELWELMIRYNDKLTGLVNEMGNAKPSDPYELENPDELNNERNLRDVSLDLSYTLHLMTCIDNEINRRI